MQRIAYSLLITTFLHSLFSLSYADAYMNTFSHVLFCFQDLHWHQEAPSAHRHGETDGRTIPSDQVPHKDAGGRWSRYRHYHTIRIIATLGITCAYHTIALTRSH